MTAYWDNGFIGEYGFAIFNRNTNTVYPTSQSLINAIMEKQDIKQALNRVCFFMKITYLGG